MGGGLVPVGGAPVGLAAAGFGVAVLGGPAAAGAVAERFGDGLVGLALQGLLKQLGAQVVAELLDDLLHLGEAGAPGGPFGAVEVVEQVFRRRLQHRTQVGRDLYRRGLCCHLELLSVVARQLDGGLAYPIFGPTAAASESCRAPPNRPASWRSGSAKSWRRWNKLTGPSLRRRKRKRERNPRRSGWTRRSGC